MPAAFILLPEPRAGMDPHARSHSGEEKTGEGSIMGRVIFSVAVTAAVVVGTYLVLRWLIALHH